MLGPRRDPAAGASPGRPARPPREKISRQDRRQPVDTRTWPPWPQLRSTSRPSDSRPDIVPEHAVTAGRAGPHPYEPPCRTRTRDPNSPSNARCAVSAAATASEALREAAHHAPRLHPVRSGEVRHGRRWLGPGSRNGGPPPLHGVRDRLPKHGFDTSMSVSKNVTVPDGNEKPLPRPPVSTSGPSRSADVDDGSRVASTTRRQRRRLGLDAARRAAHLCAVGDCPARGQLVASM